MKKQNLFLLGIILLFSLSPMKASADVSLNEFYPHPSSGSKEWVEFYNPDSTDISGYFLDDDTDFNSDSGSSAKKNLTGITNNFSTYPYLEFDNFLNNGGDRVVLFTSDGIILDQFEYTNDPGESTSIGRYPNGTGSWYSLTSSSMGSSNPSFSPSPTPSPTSAPTPSPTKSPTPSKTLTPTKTKTPTPKKSIPENKATSKDASLTEVFDDQSPTGKKEVLSEKTFNPYPMLSKILLLLGVLFLLSGAGFLARTYLKDRQL